MEVFLKKKYIYSAKISSQLTEYQPAAEVIRADENVLQIWKCQNSFAAWHLERVTLVSFSRVKIVWWRRRIKGSWTSLQNYFVMIIYFLIIHHFRTFICAYIFCWSLWGKIYTTLSHSNYCFLSTAKMKLLYAVIE